MIQFTVPGNPQGKARAFVTRRGIAFTPQKTVNYEAWIKSCFIQKYPDFKLIENPVSMRIEICQDIPKSTSKKKKEMMKNGDICPAKKPDLDNVIKCFFDSLSGLVYHNDNQVYAIEAEKYYSYSPRVEIWIEERKEEK